MAEGTSVAVKLGELVCVGLAVSVAVAEAVATDKFSWLRLPRPTNPKLPSLILVGDSTVPRRAPDFFHQRALFKSPDQRVLAGAPPDDEDSHPAAF